MKIIAASLLAVGTLVTLTAHALTINPIVNTGDTAYDSDGTTVTGTFAAVTNACVNENEDVVFAATLIRSGTVTASNDEGLWVIPGNQTPPLVNYKIAREGQTAAGAASTVLYNHFTALIPINDNGVVAFKASLRGTVTVGDNLGIYSGTAGGISLVARKGDLSPDTSGAASTARFANLEDPVIGDDASNSVTFRATLRIGVSSTAASSNDTGLWTTAGGALKSLGRESALGDSSISNAPDTGSKFASLYRPVINSSASAAFYGTLRTGSAGINSKNNAGFWIGDASNPSALQLSVAIGDVAPDTTGTFRALPTNPDMNASGEIAFNGSLRTARGGVTAANDTGIWLGDPASLFLMVRESGSAQGTGATFGSFSSPVLMSDSGDAGFVANLKILGGLIDSTNDTAIWKGLDGSTLAAVAREGDSAPDDTGTAIDSGNVVFYKLYSTYFTMNSNGQLAFRSMLRRYSESLSGFADDGIWAQQSDNTLVKVVMDNDALDGKTVMRHTFVPGSGGSDGRPRAFAFSALNDVGQMVFTAYFTNGTIGVYMAELP